MQVTDAERECNRIVTDLCLTGLEQMIKIQRVNLPTKTVTLPDGRQFAVKICPPGDAIHGKPNLEVKRKIEERKIRRGYQDKPKHRQF